MPVVSDGGIVNDTGATLRFTSNSLASGVDVGDSTLTNRGTMEVTRSGGVDIDGDVVNEGDGLFHLQDGVTNISGTLTNTAAPNPTFPGRFVPGVIIDSPATLNVTSILNSDTGVLENWGTINGNFVNDTSGTRGFGQYGTVNGDITNSGYFDFWESETNGDVSNIGDGTMVFFDTNVLNGSLINTSRLDCPGACPYGNNRSRPRPPDPLGSAPLWKNPCYFFTEYVIGRLVLPHRPPP